jgi:hypothetical protein
MLDSNLLQKQACIDDINRLDGEFEKFYVKIKECSGELLDKCKISIVTETLLKRLQEGTAIIQGMIRQIQKVEAENYQRAAGLVQLVQENLKATSKEKKAITVYGRNQLQKAALDKKQ